MLTEDQECELLVDYLRLKHLVFSHINNEMYTRSWKQKNRAKRLGVASGVPDYVILINQSQSKFARPLMLWIEMKRAKYTYPSESQKFWLERLGQTRDTEAQVCNGFDHAKEFIDTYVK